MVFTNQTEVCEHVCMYHRLDSGLFLWLQERSHHSSANEGGLVAAPLGQGPRGASL